ncbi:Uncharacterised protein [Mycobacterium tuberculosis]|nr:Uncharacterised protein [Mycobacterium tuberculosis]
MSYLSNTIPIYLTGKCFSPCSKTRGCNFMYNFFIIRKDSLFPVYYTNLIFILNQDIS